MPTLSRYHVLMNKIQSEMQSEMQKKILELAKKYWIKMADINEIFGYDRKSDAVARGVRRSPTYFDLARLIKLIDELTPEKISELEKKHQNTNKDFTTFKIDLDKYHSALQMNVAITNIERFLPGCSLEDSKSHKSKVDTIFKNQLGFATQNMWLVPDTHLLKSGLVELLSSGQKLTQLQIAVSKKSVIFAKEIINDWATSDDGNFEDDLVIQLIGQKNRPLLEVLAFYQDDDSWDGVVETDTEGSNYAPLSELGIQYLINEIGKQPANEVSWELPKSPEERILKALKKDEEIVQNQAALDCLSKHIECIEKQGYIGSGNSWENVASLLKNEVSTEVSGELQGALNGLKLRV